MKGLKIVLIDDDPVSNLIHRKLIKRVLPDVDITVFTSAFDSLDYFKASVDRPYLVFLDIHMPQMGGWDLLSELEKEGRPGNIGVYMLSSSLDPLDRNRANGFDMVAGFLQKPLKEKELIEIFGRAGIDHT
ncbi:response regulator [Echinicola soli]|uniref:Response regulator n=1 Tax=Echinicola soli TaxID=2591634 RepID=A0A514CMS3_9BACT|nr:response regulator [Echinicola soli]QDH81116.1 response regulator [Echinicola soli]